MIFPSSLASLPRNGTPVGLTAAVERAHSDRARSGSKESSSRPCATPSEAARCASTEDHQAPSLSLLRKHRTNLASGSSYDSRNMASVAHLAPVDHDCA